MTLTPNFLPVGSIVNPISGDHRFNKPLKEVYCRIVSINETSCEVKQVNDDSDASPWKFHLTNIAGITLTPEILTEWCNMKLERKQLSLNIGGELFEYAIDSKNFCIYYSKLKGWTLDSRVTKDTVFIKYLHQLQHLYSALTQTVLPITIK